MKLIQESQDWAKKNRLMRLKYKDGELYHGDIWAIVIVFSIRACMLGIPTKTLILGIFVCGQSAPHI